MTKKLILLLLIFISYQTTYSQDEIESSDLIEDLKIVQDIVIGISPKLTTEDKYRIDTLFNTKIAELENKSLSSVGFFRFITGFSRKLNAKFDEHAILSLPADVIMPFLTKSKLFPVPLKLIGNHIVVNSTETDIPFGSIIESINGLSSEEILNSLLSKEDDTFSKKRLEDQFALRYLLKLHSSDTFTISFRKTLYSDISEKEDVKGITFLEYQQIEATKVYPLNPDQLSNQINTVLIKRQNYIICSLILLNGEVKKEIMNTNSLKNF